MVHLEGCIGREIEDRDAASEECQAEGRELFLSDDVPHDEEAEAPQVCKRHPSCRADPSLIERIFQEEGDAEDHGNDPNEKKGLLAYLEFGIQDLLFDPVRKVFFPGP